MQFAFFCSLAASCGFHVEILPNQQGVISHLMRQNVLVRVFEPMEHPLPASGAIRVLMQEAVTIDNDDLGDALDRIAPRMLREWVIRTRHRTSVPPFPRVNTGLPHASEAPVAEDEET